jgi:hypothetical protein
VPPVRVALPELDLVGGQRVQRPVRGDQPGIGADPGLGLFEGAVEFGQVVERLGLVAGQRLGPRGRRPGQEVGRAGLRARRDDPAAGRTWPRRRSSSIRPAPGRAAVYSVPATS